MDCLIVATVIESGLYYDWRGVTNGVRAVVPHAVKVHEDNVEADCEMWACYEKDVDAVIAKVATEFPGVEIKAFKLFKMGQRPAGPCVIREVTKDGVLPF